MKAQLATMEPRSAQQIYVRLTEMEKIDLRRASPDRLTFLARTIYKIESGENEKTMQEVQRLCGEEITRYDATELSNDRIPSLWKI